MLRWRHGKLSPAFRSFAQFLASERRKEFATRMRVIVNTRSPEERTAEEVNVLLSWAKSFRNGKSVLDRFSTKELRDLLRP